MGCTESRIANPPLSSYSDMKYSSNITKRYGSSLRKIAVVLGFDDEEFELVSVSDSDIKVYRIPKSKYISNRPLTQGIKVKAYFSIGSDQIEKVETMNVVCKYGRIASLSNEAVRIELIDSNRSFNVMRSNIGIPNLGLNNTVEIVKEEDEILEFRLTTAERACEQSHTKHYEPIVRNTELSPVGTVLPTPAKKSNKPFQVGSRVDTSEELKLDTQYIVKHSKSPKEGLSPKPIVKNPTIDGSTICQSIALEPEDNYQEVIKKYPVDLEFTFVPENSKKKEAKDINIFQLAESIVIENESILLPNQSHFKISHEIEEAKNPSPQSGDYEILDSAHHAASIFSKESVSSEYEPESHSARSVIAEEQPGFVKHSESFEPSDGKEAIQIDPNPSTNISSSFTQPAFQTEPIDFHPNSIPNLMLNSQPIYIENPEIDSHSSSISITQHEIESKPSGLDQTASIHNLVFGAQTDARSEVSISPQFSSSSSDAVFQQEADKEEAKGPQCESSSSSEFELQQAQDERTIIPEVNIEPTPSYTDLDLERFAEEPLISISPYRLPLKALKISFKYRENISDLVDELGIRYETWTRSRGDGNCYYRSVGASYLEHLFRRTTPLSESQTFLDNLISAEGIYSLYPDDPFSANYREIFTKNLMYMIGIKSDVLSDLENRNYSEVMIKLHNLLHADDFDLVMIKELRNIAANYLQTNEDIHAFLDEPLEAQLSHMRHMGREASGVEFLCMSQALKVNINHVEMYNGYRENLFPVEGSEVTLDLLFKPGHYDILNTYEDNRIDNYSINRLEFL